MPLPPSKPEAVLPADAQESSTGQANVFDFLKEDHEKLNVLFRELQHSEDPQQLKQFFDELYSELTSHAIAEEEALYPVARRLSDSSGQAEQSYVEHAEAKQLLEEIRLLDPASDAFNGKVRDLQGAIEQHVLEEEGMLFAKMNLNLSEQDLIQLMTQVAQVKSRERTRLAGIN